MFTRKPRLQLEKFAINGAKRLLQHNLPVADIEKATSRVPRGRRGSSPGAVAVGRRPGSTPKRAHNLAMHANSVERSSCSGLSRSRRKHR
jgi:hypothetical protein